MRKYTQITVVISVLLFLIWLRSAKFAVDDSYTAGIEESNQRNNAVSKTSIPTVSPTQQLNRQSTQQTVTQQTIPPQNSTGTTASNDQTNVPIAEPQSAPTPTPTQPGQYKDGTYTGSVADAFYGNIQVQAVITGGQITDVIFLQYPNDNNTSRNINSQAMPLLKQEAIQAQSANVSGVSGASATSPAFQQSLANALSQAK